MTHQLIDFHPFCLRHEIPIIFCIQGYLYVAIIFWWYLIRYHCISFVSYFSTFRLCGKAQNFLHLLVETLEQHALADASVERSRWRTPCAREGRAPLLRARLADLMAMLLWKLSCKLHKVQLQIYANIRYKTVIIGVLYPFIFEETWMLGIWWSWHMVAHNCMVLLLRWW